MGVSEKLLRFRALLVDKSIVADKSIDVYLLPSTDAHQSEYLAPHDFRVKFFSGFSGSNAFVLVTNKHALLWTDGRYFLQADRQLSEGWTLMKQGQPDSISPTDWILQNMNTGARVAFDPQLYAYPEGCRVVETLRRSGFDATPLPGNLVDRIWDDRPPASDKPALALSDEETGESISSKLKRLRENIAKKKCDSIILGALDDIMWMLNIRGFDIPYNPLVYSVLIVTPIDAHLFIDQRKVADIRGHLQGVHIHDYEQADAWIRDWEKAEAGNTTHRVFVTDSTNLALGYLVSKDRVVCGESPVQVLKAMKNPVELEGMRTSHIRDSAALIEFLVWLEEQLLAGKPINELTAAAKVDGLRAKQEKYVDLSFTTISASGENAALPHYSADEESGKKPVTANNVYLVDSGAHYRDGTTDVTRTVWLHDPPKEFKEHFTYVLMGHIDTAALNFPDAIAGIRIDMAARHALWMQGLDFGHGVGHGVGHFLNVHEGPTGISYRAHACGLIRAGMVLTIEPGFYLENKWGIRIENCYEIVRATVPSNATNFLTFRALTLVPIQTSLIEKSMLLPIHVKWLNDYHAEVLRLVGEFLEKHGKRKELDWLKKACEPI